MDERDEKFLKDLAWSEAWFPWKKKNAIFIRGAERRSSEWIALGLSTIAVIISAAATVGTWRQTDLMTAQLTAAEANNGSLKISEMVIRSCLAIRSGPLRARKWKVYRNEEGKPAKLPIVNGKEIRITLEQRETYANALENLQVDLAATGLYRGFAGEEKARFFTTILDQVRRSLDDAIDLVDNTSVDLNYVALRAIGSACYDKTISAVVDYVGTEEIRRRGIRQEVDPLTLHLLKPMAESTTAP